MAYVAPSTLPTGTLVTSTMWAIQVNNDKFFHGPPTARVQRPALQTVTAGQWTAIAFSSKVWDSNGMFATTGTKITCKTAGKFLFTYSGGFIKSTQGTIRSIGLRKNSTGTGNPADGTALAVKTNGSFNWKASVTNIIALTTGQFVEAVCFSDGSSNGVKTSTGPDAQILSVFWVSS